MNAVDRALLKRLNDELTKDLDRVKSKFRENCKVTLVVRNPDIEDADVVMGNDDLNEAISAINRMKDRDPQFFDGQEMSPAKVN
jgi:hypothetical protein